MFRFPRHIQFVSENGCRDGAAIISTPTNQHHAQTRRVGFCPEHHLVSDRSYLNSIWRSFYMGGLVSVDTLDTILRLLSRLTLNLFAKGCWHLERNIRLNSCLVNVNTESVKYKSYDFRIWIT